MILGMEGGRREGKRRGRDGKKGRNNRREGELEERREGGNEGH